MNYFKLFDLPVNYQIEIDELERRFHHLAALYHPDRVASLSAFDKRQYMQMFTTLNEAYLTLKNPIKRAEYFLSLHNIAYDPEKTFSNDPELLEMQLLFREKIEDCQTLSEVIRLMEEIKLNLTTLLDKIADSINKKNWQYLIALIDQSKFFHKLLLTSEQKQHSLAKGSE